MIEERLTTVSRVECDDKVAKDCVTLIVHGDKDDAMESAKNDGWTVVGTAVRCPSCKAIRTAEAEALRQEWLRERGVEEWKG